MALRHPIYDDDTETIRAQIRRFCDREIEPYGETWEEEGAFPRGGGGGILYYCLAREEMS